jgi:Tol biopolymer transport system component
MRRKDARASRARRDGVAVSKTMGRNVLVAVIATMVLIIAGVAATSPGIRGGTYTDGAMVSSPRERTVLREIVWTDAAPVQFAEGDQVPATGDEYEPRFSADGTMMVFVRRKPGENADIYFSTLSHVEVVVGGRAAVQRVWSEPRAIESIRSDADELGPELSRAGDKLYFYSDREGGEGGYDLWVASKTGETWGEAENLGRGVNTPFNEYAPAVSPDGRLLYFASNRSRPGESLEADDAWRATIRERRDRHDYDVYVAEMVDGVAQEACGVSAINTEDDEGSPAISPAGDFLYFASDRAGGAGRV